MASPEQTNPQRSVERRREAQQRLITEHGWNDGVYDTPESVKRYVREFRARMATGQVTACEHVAAADFTNPSFPMIVLTWCDWLACPVCATGVNGQPPMPDAVQEWTCILCGRYVEGDGEKIWQFSFGVGVLQYLGSKCDDCHNEMLSAATHFSRNDPCPCGSGKKFKKCHL